MLVLGMQAGWFPFFANQFPMNGCKWSRSTLCPHSKVDPARTALGLGLFFGICTVLCTTTLGDHDHIGDYDMLYGVRDESL